MAGFLYPQALAHQEPCVGDERAEALQGRTIHILKNLDPLLHKDKTIPTLLTQILAHDFFIRMGFSNHDITHLRQYKKLRFTHSKEGEMVSLRETYKLEEPSNDLPPRLFHETLYGDLECCKKDKRRREFIPAQVSNIWTKGISTTWWHTKTAIFIQLNVRFPSMVTLGQMAVEAKNKHESNTPWIKDANYSTIIFVPNISTFHPLLSTRLSTTDDILSLTDNTPIWTIIRTLGTEFVLATTHTSRSFLIRRELKLLTIHIQHQGPYSQDQHLPGIPHMGTPSGLGNSGMHLANHESSHGPATEIPTGRDTFSHKQ